MKKNISKELPKLTFLRGPLSTIKVPALAVGIFTDEEKPTGQICELDDYLNGKISRVIASGDFGGGLKETLTIYPDVKMGETGEIGPERIILVGLGKRADIDRDTIKARAAAAARTAKSLGVNTIALPFDLNTDGEIKSTDDARLSGDVFTGAALGVYSYVALKTKKKLLQKITDKESDDKKEHIEEIIIVIDGPDIKETEEIEIIEEGAAMARIIADSVYLARDLINAPANLLPPRLLARTARELSHKYQLICDVFKYEELKKMKMGAFLSVAKGSVEPPAFIVIEYVPKTKGAKTVALVGKGITFDSGGLSLKTAKGMDTMKTDMGGAAVVLGVVLAAARLGLKNGVVAIIPATENMPGGNATKPGDVVTAMNGTTIEILNTDAEGRLVLADAIAYAKKYKPTTIIDIATLTGAAIVALGSKVAAINSTDDTLLNHIKEASANTGEKVWPMPLYDHYTEQIKSDIADIKNVGGMEAGSITAAAFLKHFVGDDLSWAHIDIAGTARAEKNYDWVTKGGTGFGVMLLLEFLRIIEAE